MALWKIESIPRPCRPWSRCFAMERTPAPYQAAVALGQVVGEDEAAAALIAALDDDDADVRRAAARSLGERHGGAAGVGKGPGRRQRPHPPRGGRGPAWIVRRP